MGNFTRTRPSGWTDDITTIEDFEINDLDIKTSKAVNGDEGGTWHGPVKLTDLEILTSGAVNKIYGAGKVAMDGSVGSTKAVNARKFQPDSTGTVTIDTSVTDVFTVDLTTSDCVIVTSGPPGSAQFGNITITTSTGDTDKECKKGATFRIYFVSAGGAADFRNNATFDSKLKFIDDEDKALMIDSAADVVCWHLVNTGTAGSPVLSVTVERIKVS